MSTLTACVFLLSDFKRTVVKDYGVFNEEPRALEIARDRQRRHHSAYRRGQRSNRSE
jgi:peroxiredoxin